MSRVGRVRRIKNLTIYGLRYLSTTIVRESLKNNYPYLPLI